MSLAKYQTSTAVGSSAGTTPEPCVVNDIRWKLYDAWVAAEGNSGDDYRMMSHLLRMVVTVAIGQGEEGNLQQIRVLSGTLPNIPVVKELMDSLNENEDVWQSHIDNHCCPTGICDISSISPCREGCPAGINIPNFLAEMAHGNNDKAIGIIVQDNPLPFVCGQVCPAPCEDNCVRGAADEESVFIRTMKSVAATDTLLHGAYPHSEIAPPSGKKVAILGSGPSALSASAYLTIMGHKVTCFEKEASPGGMLRYGIPGYRLPKEVLEQEIDQIRNLGVEFKTNTNVQNLDELRVGHDAVYIAVGTQETRALTVPGADCDFVHGAVELLSAIREGKKFDFGPKVIVIGAGEVAVDAVLSAHKLGADVEMFCLETREEMHASADDVAEILGLGIPIENAWSALKIEKEGKIVFEHVDSLYDDQHHFNPQFDPTKTCERPVNQVILAIGQTTNLSFVEGKDKIKIERNLIAVHPETLQTDLPDVFAGGDVIHGTRLVVDAVADGKRVAHAIDAYLNHTTFNLDWVRYMSQESVVRAKTPAEERTNQARVVPSEREIPLRYGDVSSIELDLPTLEEAKAEASRCLRCDLCVGCGLCELACAEMGVRALQMDHAQPGRLAHIDFLHPENVCIGCGACVQVCPHDALHLIDSGGTRRIEITGTTVAEFPLIKCSSCGTEYATEPFIEHITAKLPDSLKGGPARHLCPDCNRGGFAAVINEAQ